MAKFTRHDPRNKKEGRNKKHSLKRDIRIRYVEDHNNFINNKDLVIYYEVPEKEDTEISTENRHCGIGSN